MTTHPPPPTPHQILLSLLLIRILPSLSSRNERSAASIDDPEGWHLINARWVAKMLGLIMRESLEIRQPSSWSQLNDEITFLLSYAPNPHTDIVIKGMIDFIKEFPKQFEDHQAAFELLDAIPEAYIERDEDAIEGKYRVAAHSPLGIFLRRVFLGYKILTFAESCQLGREVMDWGAGFDDGIVASGSGIGRAGGSGKGKERVREGRMTINKVEEINTTIDTRLSALQRYQAACNSGDYSSALSSMRRFYDYQFPGSNKGLHQHALLNLASFHYNTGGLEVSREAIDEAIKVARAVGDRQCLRHCLALSKRLDAEMLPPVTTILGIEEPPHVADTGDDNRLETPMDELWGIKHRIDLGENLPSAYARIYRAIARQESIERCRRTDHDREKAGQRPVELSEADKDLGEIPDTALAEPVMLHAVQTALWDLFGIQSLTQLHEDLAFQCQPGSRNLDLSLLISRAQRLCRRSRCDEALALLLETYTTEGLTLPEFHLWSQAVWDVLEVDATRRDNEHSLRIIKSNRLPVGSYRQRGPGGPYRVLTHPDEVIKLDYFGRDKDETPTRNVERVRRLLARAVDMERDGPAPMVVLPDLLAAAHVSADLGMWTTFRQATVALADVLSRIETSEPGQTGTDRQTTAFMKVAAKELGPIWHQLLRSEDDDLIWTAGWILARANAMNSPSRAITFGNTALQAAQRSQSRLGIMQTTQVLALVHNLGGDKARRDEYARQWVNARDRIVPKSLINVGLGLGVDTTFKSMPMEDESAVSSVDMVLRVKEIIQNVGVKAAAGWPSP